MNRAFDTLESLMLWPALPFAMAFTTGFTVVNKTGRAIFVTPIGTVNRTKKKCQLPVVQSREWPKYAEQRSRFRVEPGQDGEILYNWDGVRLTEIVVEIQEGNPVQLLTPLPPRYVIDDLSKLDALKPDVRRVFLKAIRPRHLSTDRKIVLVLLFPLFFMVTVALLVIYILALVPCLLRKRGCKTGIRDRERAEPTEPAEAPTGQENRIGDALRELRQAPRET